MKSRWNDANSTCFVITICVIHAQGLFLPFLFPLTCSPLKANGLRSWKLQVKYICVCLMWPQDTSADITKIPLKIRALDKTKNFHFHLVRWIMINITLCGITVVSQYVIRWHKLYCHAVPTIISWWSTIANIHESIFFFRVVVDCFKCSHSVVLYCLSK
jgi:hypothetical protein